MEEHPVDRATQAEVTVVVPQVIRVLVVAMDITQPEAMLLQVRVQVQVQVQEVDLRFTPDTVITPVMAQHMEDRLDTDTTEVTLVDL